MKLKKGMYVRYTRGMINGNVPSRIAKITEFLDDRLIKIDNGRLILKEDILKSSFNLIDLIQEGDYVNCEYVISNDSGNLHTEFDDYYGDTYIKSVVTKEQFDVIKYVIERDKEILKEEGDIDECQRDGIRSRKNY